MYEINGTSIEMTRGDSLYATVTITESDGETEYTPVEGDSVRFALKKNYKDGDPLINKNIPIDTLLLHLEPEDTKELSYGKYVYDIELTKANGDVDTFIYKAEFKITEEVY